MNKKLRHRSVLPKNCVLLLSVEDRLPADLPEFARITRFLIRSDKG